MTFTEHGRARKAGFVRSIVVLNQDAQPNRSHSFYGKVLFMESASFPFHVDTRSVINVYKVPLHQVS